MDHINLKKVSDDPLARQPGDSLAQQEQHEENRKIQAAHEETNPIQPVNKKTDGPDRPST